MSGHSTSVTASMQPCTNCYMVGSLATKSVPLPGFSSVHVHDQGSNFQVRGHRLHQIYLSKTNEYHAGFQERYVERTSQVFSCTVTV